MGKYGVQKAINLENKLAKQIVMDKYELRCSIFDKTEE